MKPWAVVGLVLLAAALRLPGLWTDFWLDEIWAVDNATSLQSPLGVFTRIHHDNNHWLVSLWMYFAGSNAPVWVYRLPSLAAGISTVLVAGWLARLQGSNGRLAMLLVAVWFPLGFYASEARGYALAAFAALSAVGCLLRWLDGGGRRWLLGHWVVSSIGVLAHLSFVAVLCAEALLLLALIARSRRPLARTFLPLVGPLVTFGVLVAVDLRWLQLGGGPPLEARRLLVELGVMMFGGSASGSSAWILAFAGAGMLLALLAASAREALRRDRWEPRDALFVLYATLIVLPPLVALALRPPVLFPRFFLIGLVFVPNLTAAVLTRLGRSLRWGITLWLVVLNAWSWSAFAAVGRGGYRNALADMVASSSAPAVTVGSDHAFRNARIVAFYRSRIADGARLLYTDEAPEFYILSVRGTALAPDACPGCVLFASYPSSRLSGFEWRVFRRPGR